MDADDKYPVLNRGNLMVPVQIQISQKQKAFSQFFTAFLIYSLNFKYFEQKMILIDSAFPKLRTPKT